MISAEEFRNKYIGKVIDVDGAYGAQCVDLFKQVCYLAGMKPFSLGGSGYAEEIVKRYKPLGLDVYFTLVSLSNAQYGDWIIWSKGSHDCADSHVAMFERMDGINRIIVLGQNQFGKSYANEGSLSTHGIIGVLRLKAWSSQSTRKTNDELAQEVIEGLWGNGSERKSRLISAGYDYEVIQKLVNQKLNQNSNQKTVEKLAEEVIAGKWGNGQERIQRLKAAGFQPSVVQTKVNQLLK